MTRFIQLIVAAFATTLTLTANAGVITLDGITEVGAYHIDENQYFSFTNFYKNDSSLKEEDNAVLLFATYEDELALFAFMDKPQVTPSSGSSADLTISAMQSVAGFIHLDDSGETPATTGDTWTVEWTWQNLGADGLILGLTDFDNFTFDLTFSNTSGLSDFKFLSFDNDNQLAATYDFTSSQSVSVTSVPEPSTIALFGLALLGSAAIRRRKS